MAGAGSDRGPGTVIGPYRLVRVLGRGGLGEVHEAIGPGGARVALKLLLELDLRSRSRFVREIEAGRSLDHPGLVRILDQGEVDGIPWLAMELVSGRTLHAAVEAQGGKLAPRLVVTLAERLAEPLDHLHDQGLLHRDLKPENLMIDEQGRLKVMDLGMIRDPDRTAVTATGATVGTIFYMSPEQLLGKAGSRTSDLFAVGLILYQCLTGRRAFYGPSTPDMPSYMRRLLEGDPDPWDPERIGGPLDRFFSKALARDPDDRPQSAAGLARAFARAVESEFAPRSGAGQPGHGDEDTEDLEVAGESATQVLPEAPARISASGPVRRIGSSQSIPTSSSAPRVAAALLLCLVAAAGYRLIAGRPGEPVLVTASTGIALEGGPRLLLVRTDRPVRLASADGRAAAGFAEDRIHVLALPSTPGASVADLRDPWGRSVLVRELEGVPWKRPVWRPDPSDGTPAFSVAGEDEWGEVELPTGFWQGMTVPRPAEEARRLVEEVAPVELEELLRASWSEAEPTRSLAGIVAELRLSDRLSSLRRVIERRLAHGGEEADLAEWLAAVGNLRLLEAALVRQGEEPGYSLDALGIAEWAFHQTTYTLRPTERPGLDVLPMNEDHFRLDAPVTSGGGLVDQPEMFFVKPFGTRVLELEDGDQAGPWWLELYITAVERFLPWAFAVGTVNGKGPFLVCESPRVELQELRRIEGKSGGGLHRCYRIRLPPGVVGKVNRIELRFVPYLWPTNRANDTVTLQAIGLSRSARPYPQP